MPAECEWLKNGALSFDTETTGVDPLEARIVTAHAVSVCEHGAKEVGDWKINPGVPIPEEASKIHGITDAMVADWPTGNAVLPDITTTLQSAWVVGVPVIVMSAPYDLTLVNVEGFRCGLASPLGPAPLLVLDPLVIDRAMDPWRKGKRTLADLAAFYGVEQDGAHTARGDALCSARIVWAQAKLYRKIAHYPLETMMAWQASHHSKWAKQFQGYLRREKPDAVVNHQWPVIHA